MSGTTPKPRANRLEADVELSNGKTVRVTGLYAVEYRKDPEAVRKILEDDMRRTRGWVFPGDQADAV